MSAPCCCVGGQQQCSVWLGADGNAALGVLQVRELEGLKATHHSNVPQRINRQALTPVAHQLRPIQLETSFLEEPVQHRWLLTTCIVGVAGTLLVGGLTLGFFGQNSAPADAYAAATEQTGDISPATAPRKKLISDNLAKAQPPGGQQDTEVLPERDFGGDWSYPEISEDDLAYGDQETAVLDSEIAAVEEERGNITEITKTPPPEPVDERFKLAKNSTIVRELTNRGVNKAAAEALAKAIEPVMPNQMIRAGTEFEVTFDRQIDFYGREVTFPVELAFKPGPDETIVVSADEDGNFAARIDGKQGVTTSQYAQFNHFRASSKVGSSIYSTAKDSNIPDYIVAEFTRVFSYDVDFQHQVNASDSFEMFFGKPLTGTSSKRKVLHYAKLNYDGKSRIYYRFTGGDGHTEYYDETGRSASRALLKTPVSGARLTSGFGMRRHPLLRYSKMHTGVDFGAPTGTPIRAAGAGVIDLAGRHGAYGNTIVVKHGANYKPLYAHMSRLAPGIRRGTRVNQGQIIGYVGATGRATGPHLHYEVRVNERPVNPTTIRATGGRQLAGKDLQKFKALKAKVVAMMQQAPSATQVAQAAQ
jgi:murein DD-endopeptidase MepM/ murein hydrolase activator NlpD